MLFIWFAMYSMIEETLGRPLYSWPKYKPVENSISEKIILTYSYKIKISMRPRPFGRYQIHS